VAARWCVGDDIGVQGEVCEIKESAGSIAYILYHKERQEATFAKTPRAEVLARNPQLLERYAQAVRNWKRLPHHQNIVKAHYFDQYEEIPFLYTDYIGAGQLGELIGTPRLTNNLRQVLHFAIQISDGLAHADLNGLHVHGNLKPSNCLLTEDDNLKVTDFGLGEQLKHTNETAPVSQQREMSRGLVSPISGTSGAADAASCNPYLPPELADDAYRADRYSDVYTFGIILYEMVTGRQPYTSSEWLRLVRKQHIKLPSLAIDNTPEHAASLTALNALFQQCLALNPVQRPANFVEIGQRLRNIYQHFTCDSAPNPLMGRELEAHQLLVMGAGLGHLGYCAEELAYIDRALTIAPHLHLAWSNKGAALSATERDEDALTCLEHALTLKPKSPAALAHRGRALMNLNRYEEALASLKLALRIDPYLASAWIKKGECLDTLGRSEESACDKHALELALHSENVWEDKHDGVSICDRIALACVKKGAALAGQERFDEALICFERAVELSPGWPSAWLCKGEALMQLKRYHDAIVVYDRALALNPDDDELLVKKGRALGEANQQEAAIHYFKRALALNSDNVEALINIAATLSLSGRFAEALEYCEHALKVEEHNKEVWLLKGMLLSELARHDLAAECYKIAEQLDWPDK
jgi:tetratricopeptide (TPR) repeat protein